MVNYCTTEFGAEILMIITSFVIVVCALWLNLQMMIGSIGPIMLSDKLPSLLLSSAYALFLPLMSYTYSQAKQFKLELRALAILFWMVIIEIIRILGDSTWELRKSLEQMVRLFWVGYLICSYPHFPWGIRASLLILCICPAVYEILKGIRFSKANGSYLIGKNTQLIHNYVKRVMLEDDLKTTPIDSCDYIVMGETNHQIVHCRDGYNLGEKKSNSEGLFTVGRAFQLKSSEHEVFTKAYPSWRDTCLSFALAKMLRRRFAKLPVDEAGCRKALDFVVGGLIDDIGSNNGIETDKNDGEKNRSKRAFSIIQEELQFVSDFFNVKVPFFNSKRWNRYYLVDSIVGVVMSGIWAYLAIFTINKMYSGWLLSIAPRLKAYRYNNCSYYVHNTSGSPVMEVFYYFDEYITIFLLFAYMFLYASPLYISILSKRWRNLNSVKMYVKDPADWNRSFYIPLALFMKKANSVVNSRPFQFLYIVFLIPLANFFFMKKARTILDLEAETILFCIKVPVPIFRNFSKCIRRNIPRSFPTVVPSTDAKQAILESLKKSVARLSVGETSLKNFDEASLLTNGKTSLKNHNMESLNWACTPNGSTTEAILVWHIATTLFHHLESSPQQNNDPHQKPATHENNNSIKEKREVALELSLYCHYLVKFLPELLPDEVEWTEEKYESVIKEILGAIRWSCCRIIKEILGIIPWFCCTTRNENCNNVLQHTEWVESSVVGKGVKLANQLMDYDKEGQPVWAMLADFWAEMMLFIAPSDNVEGVKGHEKILYRKELITQLWALLTHAGIVTKSKPTDHQVHDSKSNACFNV